MKKRFRIAVVDDHPLIRGAIVSTLSCEQDFEVVSVGENASDALRICSDDSPDLMLLDIGMPGCGLHAARKIKASSPEVSVLFLTASEEHADVTAALEAGACGYILKSISGADLVSTIRCVATGATYITPALAAQLLTPVALPQTDAQTETSAIDQLTQLEKQILKEVGIGFTNKEVAERLGTSERTIKYYMTNILNKLGVRNRVEAIAASSKLKLLH
jgi:two-component system nitrate/nitrite response regulator NarL